MRGQVERRKRNEKQSFGREEGLRTMWGSRKQTFTGDSPYNPKQKKRERITIYIGGPTALPSGHFYEQSA